MDAFTHISERDSRAADLCTSLCAVLIAQATNTGFEPLVHQDVPALRRDRLSWVEQNYVRGDPQPGQCPARRRAEPGDAWPMPAEAAKWPRPTACVSKGRGQQRSGQGSACPRAKHQNSSDILSWTCSTPGVRHAEATAVSRSAQLWTLPVNVMSEPFTDT